MDDNLPRPWSGETTARVLRGSRVVARVRITWGPSAGMTQDEARGVTEFCADTITRRFNDRDDS